MYQLKDNKINMKQESVRGSEPLTTGQWSSKSIACVVQKTKYFEFNLSIRVNLVEINNYVK